MYAYVCRCPGEAGNKYQLLLGLELQAVVCSLTGLLGTELRPLAEWEATLDLRVTSPVLNY